jgi:hypothetical protein
MRSGSRRAPSTRGRDALKFVTAVSWGAVASRVRNVLSWPGRPGATEWCAQDTVARQRSSVAWAHGGRASEPRERHDAGACQHSGGGFQTR